MFLPWIKSKNILKKYVRWAKVCPLKKIKKSKNRKCRYLSVEIVFLESQLVSGGFVYKDYFPKRILDNSQNWRCSIPGKWTFLLRFPAIGNCNYNFRGSAVVFLLSGPSRGPEPRVSWLLNPNTHPRQAPCFLENALKEAVHIRQHFCRGNLR